MDALQQRIRERIGGRWHLLGPGPSTVALDLADDEDFGLALAIAPYTIGGTGLSRGALIWDGNDTGTSATFDLTPGEQAEVLRYVAAHGGDVRALVPFDG